MNRVHLSILSQKSHTNITRRDSIQQLNSICHPQPLKKGWISQKFPLYPIQFDFYLANPPFNKIQIVFYQKYKPDIMEILGSADGKEYFKIQTVNKEKDDFQKLKNISDGKNSNNFKNKNYQEIELVCKFFKQTHYYNYLRCRIYQNRHKNQVNLCQQIGIKAIQLSNITIFNTKYICSLKKRLQLHPSIFSYLQLLQYKSYILSTRPSSRTRNSIKQKYLKRINQIQQLIYKNKLDSINPSQQLQHLLTDQFQLCLNQPLDQQTLDLSNPVQLKQQIKHLQQQLSQFYVDRLNNIHKNVEDYFKKYWNVEIRDIYLRLLSSNQDDDHTKALTEYWVEIKGLDKINVAIEQAMLMFLNYYLQYISDPIKSNAIKILCLFIKQPNIGFKLYSIYQRILFNLISGYLKHDNPIQLTKLFLKSIFSLYQKIPNSIFLQQFLNPHTHSSLEGKLKKLQILQKIVVNDVKFQIENDKVKDKIIEFLLEVLLKQQIKVQDKNKVYNVAAVLANNFGKQPILSQFEKLNSMLLMNMEKIIDKKLQHIKSRPGYINNNNKNNNNNNQLPSQQPFRTMCDYCGLINQSFSDQNIYDIHCFKQCLVLTQCQYCNNIVQIPQLSKHYLSECTLKNKFKNCDNCNDVIFIQKQDQHNKKCMKNFVTKCPLCAAKLQSKLRIKEHILKDGCPNNSRNVK